jgi:hypothetical protein
MVNVAEIIKKLNQYLNDADFKGDDFGNQLKLLIDHEKVKVKIVDFEPYNEKDMQDAYNEKIKEVLTQNFEKALIWRLKEKKIKEYLTAKKQLKIKESGFHFEDGYLFFFHLGTEKNDHQIKEIIDNLKK